MGRGLDALLKVSITREDVSRCSAEHQDGPVPGCPMCFLRAEYTILELFKVSSSTVLAALERGAARIKQQILEQEQRQKGGHH